MFRLKTLALLLALVVPTAVLTTGCDGGSKGTSKKGEAPPPPKDSNEKVPPQELPKVP